MVRYFVKYLKYLPESHKYLVLLEDPYLQCVSSFRTEMFLRIYRPYINKSFTFVQKYKAISYHYRFIALKIPLQQLTNFFKQGILLAIIKIEEMGDFSIIMEKSKWENEGEISINLYADNYELIYSITFTIVCLENKKPSVLIGAIQGGRSKNIKQVIKNLTKHLFRMRPKNLILFILREICNSWRIYHVQAVGNSEQMCGNSPCFYTNYDLFWSECGATYNARDSVYIIDSKNRFKNLTSIQTHKRSLYKKRYAWLDSLRTELHQKLQELQSLHPSSNR